MVQVDRVALMVRLALPHRVVQECHHNRPDLVGLVILGVLVDRLALVHRVGHLDQACHHNRPFLGVLVVLGVQMDLLVLAHPVAHLDQACHQHRPVRGDHQRR